jgi:hypothetical protein
MSVHVKGFGCRPFEGRRSVLGGRRPKASKGALGERRAVPQALSHVLEGRRVG